MKLIQSLMAAGALAVAFASAPAHALAITPGGTTCTTNNNSNLNEAEVEALASCFGTFDLSLAYKDNVGGIEEGPFAASYITTYSNTALDPSDALIQYVLGMPAISCPSCFLLVKDGSQIPAQYLFDISSWNGIEDLVLTGFWPNQGAISHIAIYTGNLIQRRVPEPGSLALLGVALLALAASRRRR